jgi:hypothetical protein
MPHPEQSNHIRSAQQTRVSASNTRVTAGRGWLYSFAGPEQLLDDEVRGATLHKLRELIVVQVLERVQHSGQRQE